MGSKEQFDSRIEEATSLLMYGKVSQTEFEDICKGAWVELNGPVPEGRELVVGIVDGGISVGHVDKPQLDSIRFAKLLKEEGGKS